jgi:uncharacterized membrane protein (DUF373 family)
MKKIVRKRISTVASAMEILISAVILLAIAVATVFLVIEVGGFIKGDFETEVFTVFLGHALNLVIGVEFIKMLCKHTPGAAIEVLVYAIARKLIVEHASSVDTLIGIAAIGGLFAVRKFLFIHAFDEHETFNFSAEATALHVARIVSVRIPAKKARLWVNWWKPI